MNRKQSEGITDRANLAEARENELLAEIAQLEDVVTVMNTPSGRRFVYHLLDIGQAFGEVMTGSSWTFFNLGKRDMALRIMDMTMKACPDKYSLMLEERNRGKVSYIDMLRQQVLDGGNDNENVPD